MDTTDLIEQAFPDQTLRQGRSLYVQQATAFAVVRFCRDHGIAILGLEAFAADGRSLRPRLDRIADFSELEPTDWTRYVDATTRSAELVLSAWDEEALLVDFTLAVQEGSGTVTIRSAQGPAADGASATPDASRP